MCRACVDRTSSRYINIGERKAESSYDYPFHWPQVGVSLWILEGKFSPSRLLRKPLDYLGVYGLWIFLDQFISVKPDTRYVGELIVGAKLLNCELTLFNFLSIQRRTFALLLIIS